MYSDRSLRRGGTLGSPDSIDRVVISSVVKRRKCNICSLELLNEQHVAGSNTSVIAWSFFFRHVNLSSRIGGKRSKTDETYELGWGSTSRGLIGVRESTYSIVDGMYVHQVIYAGHEQRC